MSQNTIKQSFETDWLGSKPVFYNEKTQRASHNIKNVIDICNFEFDHEGLANYLDFGYSTFGKTLVQDVLFLPPCSILSQGEKGKFSIVATHDPVEDWLGKETIEADVLDRISKAVQDWEKSIAGPIVIPTSGGYDSRLLNIMINNRARIRSYTYGLSEKQRESFEVVKAKKLADILGTECRQIQLGRYHEYFDEWDDIFGISTHAHGMYHMEFYSAIREYMPEGGALLSGIIGDAWAGGVEIPAIEKPEDLHLLGYTHGLRVDPAVSQFGHVNTTREKFFQESYTKLKDPLYRIVAAMRLKMILLNYLMAVPASRGFTPWSPFLIPDIALAMLNLPKMRRRGRVWQRDFFQNNGVDLESMSLSCDPTNSLDMQAMRQVRLKPLNTKLISEVIKPAYVEQINRQIVRVTPAWEWLWRQMALRPVKVGEMCKSFGIHDERSSAYCAYLVLKPIEALLERRNNARSRW